MAILGRRQPFKPIILRNGPLPPAPAKIVMPIGRFVSQSASLIAHRLPLHPYFGRLSRLVLLPVAGPAFVRGAFAAWQAATIAHRAPVHALVNRLGSPQAVASPNIIRGGFAARQAAMVYHRPLFQPTIKTLIQYEVVGPHVPIASPVIVRGVFASQKSVEVQRHPLLRPWISKPIQFAAPPPSPLLQTRSLLTGFFASQQASLWAHRLPFQPIINVVGVTTVTGTTRGMPFLPRVPNAQSPDALNRLARFTEIMSAVFNSLARQGILRQTGPGEYTIVTTSTLTSVDGGTWP